MFHWVLGQGKCGAEVLTMAVGGGKADAVCVTIKGGCSCCGGEGSVVNKIAEEEEKK